MSQDEQQQRVEIIKNYVPTTPPPSQEQGHGVEGNFVPTTGSSQPNSAPPKPKK